MGSLAVLMCGATLYASCGHGVAEIVIVFTMRLARDKYQLAKYSAIEVA